MKKIMIVDDSMFMRMILRNVIQDLGYETAAEATNGLEALTLYPQIQPDLVTLDITMPEMDGLTALTELKAKYPDSKIMMVSAMGQQALLIKAVSIGACDFIVKPFNKERVREALEKALSS